jgi:hypothetical protein
MSIKNLVICMANDGYGASLELHKVYAVMDPIESDPEDYCRILDESGEDYLYPADWFEAVNLAGPLEARIIESVLAA